MNRQLSEMEQMCDWLKKEKGITKIDILELVDYKEEFEEWRDNQLKVVT